MDEKELRVRKSKEIRLKDIENPFLPIIFERDFGFIPEAIIIEKVPGVSNKIIVNAVLTKEEIEKEDKELAEREEKHNKGIKKLETLEKLEKNGK